MGAGTILNATDVGGMVQGMAESLIEEYSARLDDDVEWAMDWSRRDDDYSRLDNQWVNIALASGVARHFNVGYWNETFNADLHSTHGSSSSQSAIANTVLRRFPGSSPKRGVRIPGARTTGALETLSPFEIRRQFRKSGVKVRDHFIDRIRGVGPDADPERMRGLGIRSIEDLQQVLRYGYKTRGSNGNLAFTYRGVSIITNPQGSELITIVTPVKQMR